MTDYVTKQIYGTAQTVINTATDVASGYFSTDGQVSATFNNTNDAAVPYALWAEAMIEMPDWGAAPTAGYFIELWGILKDTDGTEDDTDTPSGATTPNGARYFGAWPAHAADAGLQRRTIIISLRGCRQIDFYIKNATDTNLNNDGGTSCVVKITPFTDGFTA